jgi:hypothetical protein
MKYANLKWIAATIVAVVVVGSAFVAAAGVRDAGSKIRGDFTSFHRSASRNMSTSRNTSRDVRSYARSNQRSNQTVTPAIARAHAEELGQSVKLTQKYLAEERKVAEAQKDKEILAKLDQVDKYVAQEAAAQAKLLKECSGDKVDAAGVVECCEQCEVAIDKAIELHDEIAAGLEDTK